MVAVETFLDEDCATACDRIPGYCHWIRRDRVGGQGGGIAVCFREGLHAQPLSVQTPDEMETMFLRLILADKSAVLLCALYRPQWQGSAPLTFLTEQLDHIVASHDCQNTLIVGDLNQHLVYRAFTELTVVHALHNHVNFPTHVRGGSLDPVLSDFPEGTVQCRPLDYVGTSDHNAVMCEVSLTPGYEEDQQREIWLWERANWTAIKQLLATKDWSATLDGDINHNVAAFTSALLSIQRDHVPHRSFVTSPRDQPWFGYRCRAAAEHKYKAWTRLQRHPTPRNRALHRQACKAMKRTSSWAKARWERNLKGKLSSNQVDPKQWWSLVKQKQGSTSHERIPALKLPTGDLATGRQEKADVLATYFSNKITLA